MLGFVDNRVIIPTVRAIIGHAWLNVLLGKIVPTALFVFLFTMVGTTPAIVAALAWSFGVVGYQRATGQRVAGLVILAIIGNTAKTILALLTGSLLIYFAQPTISTVLIGLAFLVSIPLGKPLAERLVHDICPLDDFTANHPELRRFFPRLSALWAVSSLLNGGLTLYLLMSQSLTTFVVIKAFMGPGFTATTFAIAAVWFRLNMSRAGVSIVFASRVKPTPAPLTLQPHLAPALRPAFVRPDTLAA